MADYIPETDRPFAVWANNFLGYIDGHLADLGLDGGDLEQLSQMQADFNAKMADHIAAHAAAKSARLAKDDSRNEFKSAIRQLVRQLQVSDSVDDSQRGAMGITVADKIRTANSSPITTKPVGRVDTSQRLRHKIHFGDQATPTKRAKPAKVLGCEIWVKLSAVSDAAPCGGDELSFVAMDTASPHTVRYAGSDGGKMAHYMLRWVKRGGQKGPWSETISATITA